MALNKAMLIGNVGKDPEVRHLESGIVVASFTLATTERFKDKSGVLREQTEWHNIVCWRNLADLADKYIKKGSQIYVEGRIRTRNWDDQNGVKHYATEIVADTIQLLGKKSDSPASSAPVNSTSYSAQPTQPQQQISAPAISPAELQDDSDDLPF